MIKCWYCNEELTSATYREEHIGICTNCYRSMFQGNKIVKGWMDKISDLEEKLAEKEEQLKYYETLLKRQCNECKNQDKISFAVEQLEKVKEWVKKRFEEISCIYEEDAIEYINNQIKQLKEE